LQSTFKQEQNPRHQGMARCAKINGIPSTVIIKRFLTTTKVRATSYWDLSLKDQDKFHLPRQFNEDCYNTIEVF
jgi:hypothetical protein